MTQNNLVPTFFSTKSELRKWFEKNHRKAEELLVGFYKVGTKKSSITWSESVDEAICFGWIDGVRRSIDNESYCIRFTPRKTGSIWSAINIKKVEVLSKQGLMQPSGIAAFEKRQENKSRIYSYEKESPSLPDDFLKKFKANKKAWNYFQSMAPSYQKTCIHWIIDAKQEATKIKRLEELICDSEAGRKIKRLSY
ncbi:MAG TPA: YdeI/OmpD-associated family protein [Hanamia sp.]|nr:YdeI/OmpD-associated family protein [Hanamia sp.]